MFNEIKSAIVGTGFMGWVHAEALRRLGVCVHGILGSTPEKSAAAAKRLGIETAYDAYPQLLADPEVDCVHINTPNRMHFEMAKQAIEAGKHVLCEKPLAMTAAESAELVRLAEQNPQLAAGVNYNIRYYPLCREAAARVAKEDLGAIFHIAGSYTQDWLLFPTDYNWRVLAEEGGELRAIADIGTHWLDLVQTIAGTEIESLCADLQTVHPVRHRPRGEVETFAGADAEAPTDAIDIGTEDAGCVLLRFRGGTRGVLQVSQVTAGRKNALRFEVAGERASLAWNSETPNEMQIGYRDTPNETLLRDPSLLAPSARSDYPGGHNEGYADSFKECFRAFYSHIAATGSSTPDFPTFADGHREILLCEAILRSHKQRAWVDVPGS